MWRPAPDSGLMTSNGMSLYKTAKLSVLRLAQRAGVSTRVRDSDWRASRLLIVAYHGVSLADEHEWNAELYMPPELLRARLAALRDGGYQEQLCNQWMAFRETMAHTCETARQSEPYLIQYRWRHA